MLVTTPTKAETVLTFLMLFGNFTVNNPLILNKIIINLVLSTLFLLTPQWATSQTISQFDRLNQNLYALNQKLSTVRSGYYRVALWSKEEGSHPEALGIEHDHGKKFAFIGIKQIDRLEVVSENKLTIHAKQEGTMWRLRGVDDEHYPDFRLLTDEAVSADELKKLFTRVILNAWDLQPLPSLDDVRRQVRDKLATSGRANSYENTLAEIRNLLKGGPLNPPRVENGYFVLGFGKRSKKIEIKGLDEKNGMTCERANGKLRLRFDCLYDCVVNNDGTSSRTLFFDLNEGSNLSKNSDINKLAALFEILIPQLKEAGLDR